MTWSYNPSALTTSAKDQVRRLIGDVIAADPQIQDEEIGLALMLRSSIYGAAADGCRYIAAQYSRKSDIVTQTGGGGALKTNYSTQARAYLTMAANLEAKSVALGGGLPFAGGVSVSDKQNREQDPDRVSPQFNIGMDDNYVPVSSLGNETSSDAPSETSQ